jgi:hydroxymethylglutaryl-CoA lyase
MKGITRRKGTRYLTHIPNQKGLERALQMGIDSVIICLSASDESARREDDDCNSTQDCLTNKLQYLVRDAQAAKVWIRIFLTSSWGCPYTGATPPEKVEQTCKTLLDYGVDEICLADNLAAATPSDVNRLLAKVEKIVPREKLALHFHDNRGMGISNTLAGLAHGVSVIDVAVGGLGANTTTCKYSPMNPVMLPTEDLLFLLNGMGVETGVDLDKASAAGKNIASLLQVRVLSRYGVAGPVEQVR